MASPTKNSAAGSGRAGPLVCVTGRGVRFGVCRGTHGVALVILLGVGAGCCARPSMAIDNKRVMSKSIVFILFLLTWSVDDYRSFGFAGTELFVIEGVNAKA